jgi:hypothetical protein
MEIYTLAVDLKLPENGQIQILEVMAAHHAGSAGYNMIPGHKRMQQDLIFGHLKTLAAGRSFFVPSTFNTNLFKAIADNTRDIMTNQGGVLYPLRQNSLAQISIVERDELGFCNKHARHLDTVNADQTFLCTINDKALTAFLVKRDEEGEQSYSGTFAPAVVLPTQYHKGMAADIKAALGAHDSYVIKPVEAAQGSGVRIVSSRKLDAMLKRNLVGLRKFEAQRAGKDYWRSDILPVFVAQPYVASKPVAGMGRKARRQYDGTMRVFLTLHRDDAGAPFQVKTHDAYWKLPRNSIKSFGRQDKAVSHSPHRLESETFGKFLREIFNGHADTINSAPVSAQDKDIVFPQVEESVDAFLRDLLSQSLHQRITNLLNSEDKQEQSAGILLAVHPTYFVSADTEMLSKNRRDFPESFRARIKEIAADKTHPSYLFLRIFANHFDIAEPLGLGRDLKEFFDDEDQKEKAQSLMSIISAMKL